MKASDIPCILCGWAAKINGSDHCNDNGPWIAACTGCGAETLAWAYQREAWKQWREMNTSSLGKHAKPVGVSK